MRASRAALTVITLAAVWLGAGCGGTKPEAFRIGILTDCFGPFSTLYETSVASAELPLLERGGRLVGNKPSSGVAGARVEGRQAKIEIGCVSGSDEVIPVARHLVEELGVQAVVGPFDPQEGMILREYARRQPATAFLIQPSGAPELTLTKPAPNVFRFAPDAAQSVAGAGSYVYRELGWRTAAIVADDIPYSWEGAAGFISEFCSLGGRIVDRAWIPVGADPAAAVPQLPPTADGVYLGLVLSPALGFLKRYAAHHDVSRRLVSTTPLLYDPRVIPLTRGVVVAGSLPVQPTAATAKYAASFAKAFPAIPAPTAIDPTVVPYRDGVEALLEALDRSGGKTGAPLLAALARQGLDSPMGRIHLDANRQAIGPNYLSRIAVDAKGKPAIRTVRVVPNVDQTFGGYLAPGDPPPNRDPARLREAAAAEVGAMSMDPRLGSELAGYRLEALLGRGGMGVVYRAHDLALDRNVALKILSPELAEDERFRERFLTESRLAASIDHPNIIPVYDAGEVAGELYIAMRYVDGSDLKRLLAEGPLSKERAITIVAQVAGALDAAHERGLVHRDVKPSNVLLDERGHAYLADFGLSRRLGEPGAALGAAQSLGTIDYVAPEQIRGEQVDGRADLYSLGCLLHECLTGRPPFSRPTDSAVLYAHLEEEPPAAPGLEDVMRTALAKEPDKRFPSGHELVEAARQALGIADPKRSRWPLAAAVVGVTLIGAALAAFFLTRGGGSAALPGADTVIRIDPKTNAVTDRIPVGRKTSGLAVGAGHVWVANLADGTISMIDPGTKQVRTIAVQGAPTGIAVGDGTAVVADGAAHKLTAFDASTGTLTYPASLRGPSNGTLQIAGGTGGIWFADAAGGIVGKIDDTLTVGSPSRQLPVPPDSRSFASAYFSFAGLAIGERAIWVAGDARDRAVWRLDPRTGRVAAKIPLRFVPDTIAVGEGAVWVTSLLDDTVSRIDPASNRITARIHTGRGVAGLAAGQGGVWVANSFDGTASRIDPLTNRVVATVPVGGTPKQVAAGANGIWLTTRAQPSAAPADSITVGVLSDCEGTPRYTAAYNDTIAPAELPLIERGGKRAGTIADGVEGVSIGGHPIRIALGCADGTTGSALAEWRRLVEQAGADVVIGPLSGDEGLALPEYARRQPGIAFVNGSASSQQLRPARNTFSFWYDGAQWMAGVGAYAYKQLGWRTAVTIGGADTFDWAQVAGFDAEFCALGGTIVKRLWLPQEAQDFAGLVAKVPRSGVDGFLVEAQGPGPLLTLARDYPGLRGNLARKVVAGTTVVPPPKLGARVRGIVWGGPTNNPPRAYLATLRRAFPEIAKDYLGFAFDYAYYDAMTATLQALDRVHGDLSDGEKRFMAALAHVELDAPNGRTTLDASHRAIAPNTLFETLTASTSRVLRTIPAVDASFGGYFKPSDPPPGKTTPACVKRTPPPWAR